jgi:NodT family efflux transporter outer membrane factor (OMF) lipoprotein
VRPTRQRLRDSSLPWPHAALWCAAIACLSGCASPEAGDPLPLQDAPAFSASGDAPLSDEWWTAFEDEYLNERIHDALTENFTLAAAWERLRQAEAIVERERAALLPKLDGTAGAERFEYSDQDDRTELSLGLQASYEVDLWGRIESAVEAERFRAAASATDYQTAAISLSAEVALAWYQLVVARLGLKLVESQLETNLTVLDVLEMRFAVGQSGSADVLRQRQLVESSREQIVIVQSQIEVLEHQLAVLLGRPPQETMDLPSPALPRVAELPATGVPAALLQRRPDVLGAFLRLKAADEEVAVAVADQYPRINLSASLSTAAETPSGLFSEWLATLAGRLVAPLLDGGERRAEVERTVAARRERLAQYGQTVLEAFRDVEDALAQEANQVRRIRSLETQLTLARRTIQQLRSQYLNGVTDFIDVLTALRDQQQLERDLLTARLDRLAFRIALYRALAGGFETPREESEITKDVHENDSNNDGDAARG